MKILILHQPFPMGNYHLSEHLGRKLAADGHEVHLLTQLNDVPASFEYVAQIHEQKFDVVYFEMLDIETFKVVEQLNKSLRILTYASGGVLKTIEKIVDKSGKWYDRVLTNSVVAKDAFVSKGVVCEHFPFYFNPFSTTPQYKEKYDHKCVFLGMGFNRLTDPTYKLERDLFFSSPNLTIYGNGWSEYMTNYKGLLPEGENQNLYFSSNCAVSIIAAGQRKMGMINNRYTEVVMSRCPLITYPYPEIDWFGLDKHMFFVQNQIEFNQLVQELAGIDRDDEERNIRLSQAAYFMESKSNEFYNKLKFLLT